MTQHALVEVGLWLRRAGYQFITPTPSTHRLVNDRPRTAPPSLTDIFGWSRPFGHDDLPGELLALAGQADLLRKENGQLWSRVRFSTLGDDLFVHSAYPTTEPNAVFFGPDSYRFVAFAQRSLPSGVGRLVDVACGTGVGGLCLRQRATELVLADINPHALGFAAVNAALAGWTSPALAQSDLFATVAGDFDTIIANPPYLPDPHRRIYRDGGGPRGTMLSARIVAEALPRLREGGRLVVYTATPVVAGRSLLIDELAPLLAETAHEWQELDPDVFGDELALPCHADVDRLSLVGLVARK